MPDMYISGCYYNPLLNTWVEDPTFSMPYVVVDSETPSDAGLDFVLKEGVVDKPVDMDDPIQVDDNLYIKQVDEKYSSSSYIRIYNYESTKMPKNVYSLDKKSKDRPDKYFNLSCFSKDDVPSDTFGYDDNSFEREKIDDSDLMFDLDTGGDDLFDPGLN